MDPTDPNPQHCMQPCIHSSMNLIIHKFNNPGIRESTNPYTTYTCVHASMFRKCSFFGFDVKLCENLYHRERILETSTLSCNEEEEDITKPPKR